VIWEYDMLIKNLSFKFDIKDKNYFFKDILLACIPHTINTVVGDNGVGKSTLFSILRGNTSVDTYLEGSMDIGAYSYQASENRFPPHVTKHIHLVGQNYDAMLAPHFNFMENLQGASFGTYPALSFLPQPVLFDVIKQMQINVRIPVYKLSGGQRQLLAICMALQKPTEILLLDEPTATLDVNNAHLIMRCIQLLAKELKITVLVICHDPELVKQYTNGARYFLKKTEEGERILIQESE
jgi:ABC-type glutathione transport system ATPase component